MVVVTGLLIGQIVDNCITELEILVGRYFVQVIDQQLMHDLPATTLDLDPYGLANHAIKRRRKRDEFGDEFTVDANEDISRLNFSGRR